VAARRKNLNLEQRIEAERRFAKGESKQVLPDTPGRDARPEDQVGLRIGSIRNSVYGAQPMRL